MKRRVIGCLLATLIACILICVSPIILFLSVEMAAKLDRGQCAAAVDEWQRLPGQNPVPTFVEYTLDQDQVAPIHPTNVSHLVQLERLGRGVVRDTFWGADGNPYVLTSVGLWRHDIDHRDLHPELVWSFQSVAQSFTLSPDNKLLAIQTTSHPEVLPIWSVETGEEVIALQATNRRLGALAAVAFNHQGHNVATALGDDVYVWDIQSGAQISHFSAFTGLIDDMEFSPDDRYLAVAGSDFVHASQLDIVGTVRIWDLRSGSLMTTIRVDEGNGIETIGFSPDGDTLASGGGFFDASIRLWNREDGLQIASWERPSGYGKALRFSSDGRLLIHGSEVYDAATGDRIALLEPGENAQLSTDELFLMTSLPAPVVWQIEDFSPVWRLDGYERPSPHQTIGFDSNNRLETYGFPATYSVVVSPNERVLLLHESYPFSSDGNSFLRVCSILERNQLTILEGGFPVLFSHSGHLLATSDYCGISLWDASSPDYSQLFTQCSSETEQRSEGGRMTAIAFSADDRILAVALQRFFTYEPEIQLLDTGMLQPLTTLRGHTDLINDIAFSGDNRLMGTSSRDGTIRLWGVPG